MKPRIGSFSTSTSFLLLPLLLLLLAFFFTPTSAWGPDGHRIVALIAQHLLTPTAHLAVRDWTLGKNISDLANDADVFLYNDRKSNGWSAPMHYIDCPVDAVIFDPVLHCPAQPGCVYSAILNYTARLKNTPAPTQQWNKTNGLEPSALAFAIHYIGDLHQPLHVGYDVDLGGNRVIVKFFKNTVNLHALWDSGILNEKLNRMGSNYTWSQYAYDLLKKNITFLKQAGSNSDVLSWTRESFDIVRARCYNFLPENIPSTPTPSEAYPTPSSNNNPKTTVILGEQYYQTNIPIVEQQLMKAGARLAATINRIFDGPHPSSRIDGN